MTTRPDFIRDSSNDSNNATATADELLPMPKLGESVADWRDRLPTRHAFLAAMRELEHGITCEDFERDHQLAAHAACVAVTLMAHGLRIDGDHASTVGMLCVMIDGLGIATGQCPAVLARELAATIPAFARRHHKTDHCRRTEPVGH